MRQNSSTNILIILKDFSFYSWCKKNNERSSVDSIDLFNSILDFESKIKISNTCQLSLIKQARHIHRKYISLNTGICHFINDETRTLMSNRIHELLGGKSPYKELFDPLKQQLSDYLQNLYFEFSTKFHDKMFENEKSIGKNKYFNNSIWFDDDGIDKSSRHELQMSATSHESESSRFEFFNAVCSRLTSLQENETKSSSYKSDEEEISIYDENPPLNIQPYKIENISFLNKQKPKFISNLPKRFESLYRKKRESTTSDSSGFNSGINEFLSFEKHGKSNTNTLNRPKSFNNGFSTLQPKKVSNSTFLNNQKLCIELRYEDDIPMVAKIENQEVTFRYFRFLFGIRDHQNSRYFFKSNCECGTALYQWTLIFQDDDILPVFQGKIVAMCRLSASFEIGQN